MTDLASASAALRRVVDNVERVIATGRRGRGERIVRVFEREAFSPDRPAAAEVDEVLAAARRVAARDR